MTIAHALAQQERSWALHAEGRLDEAAAACRDALRLIEASEGPSSLDVANLLNELADIEQDRGQLAAALALAERARAIADAGCDRRGDDAEVGDAEVRIRLRTLALMGGIRRLQGDCGHAESDLRQALTIAVETYGDTSEEAAEARNNLGLLCKHLGRWEEGLRLYERALEIIIAIHGDRSLPAGALYHNIGGMLHAQGKYAAAEAPARRAWEISSRQLGGDDPRTMRDAVAYGAILDGLGAYETTERIYRRALAVFEQTYGPDHEEVGATLHNLAAVRDVRGDRHEAERCYRRALAIRERLFGPDSLDAALTQRNLAALLERF